MGAVRRAAATAIAWAGRNNVRGVLPYRHAGVVEDMIVYYAKSLAENGHTITPDHLCMFTETFIADSKKKAIEEYSPHYLYCNQTLWYHGSLPAPAQSHQRRRQAAVMIICGPRTRRMPASIVRKFATQQRPTWTARSTPRSLVWGKPSLITDYPIHVAESTGSNVLLINMNLGALPKENFLNQTRRFGTEVLPTLQKHEIKRIPERLNSKPMPNAGLPENEHVRASRQNRRRAPSCPAAMAQHR